MQEAFAEALHQEDSLAIVCVGSILSAVMQSQQMHEDPGSVAEPMLLAALERKNWLGVADAQLVRAEHALQTQGLEQAVRILMLARLQLIELRGSTAAVHLLIARLAELHAEYGAELFEPILLKS
jgi:hypothetical protein